MDDHTLVREGMAQLLTQHWPGLQLIQAHDARSASQAAADHGDLRLVLLDLTLPDASGLDGLRLLRAAAPRARIVVVSADERPSMVLSAIDAGACGYVPKTAAFDSMTAALRVVVAGGLHLPESLAAPADGLIRADDLGLTARQQDVLQLLLEGRSNKLICRELSLSASTVKTHLEAIFKRLNVNSRTQAVVEASRRGLRIDIEPGASGNV